MTIAIIIDANRCGDFSNYAGKPSEIILLKIKQRKLFLVTGGLHLKEILKTQLRDFLVELERIGLLEILSDDTLRPSEISVEQLNIRSDDPHILALASVSGCRLIYTDDRNLIIDFKNKSILNPKGRVITSRTKSKTVSSMLS